MARLTIDPTLDAAVAFEHVTLTMPRRRRRGGGGRRHRLRRMAGDVRWTQRLVLEDASFAVEPGESVAVIGLRSGPRTEVLRLAAGTLLPDRGIVRRSRPFLPMIEIGRTFSRGYTIRQNIHATAALLGMAPSDIAAALPAIAEQAGVTSGLDRFLGRTAYLVRQKLAWSIAMAAAPAIGADAYAIDNILLVGDEAFRERARAHAEQLRAAGATFLLVSDLPEQVRWFCDRAIYLDGTSAVSTDIDSALAMLREARARAREDDAPPDEREDDEAGPF